MLLTCLKNALTNQIYIFGDEWQGIPRINIENSSENYDSILNIIE